MTPMPWYSPFIKPDEPEPEGVTVFDPVLAADIAIRVGVTAPAVSNWINRYPFPRPALMVGPRRSVWIWEWADVDAFLTEHQLPGGQGRKNRDPNRWNDEETTT